MTSSTRAAAIPKPGKAPPSFGLAPQSPKLSPSGKQHPQDRAAPGDDTVRWLLGGVDDGAPIQRMPIAGGYGDVVAAAGGPPRSRTAAPRGPKPAETPLVQAKTGGPSGAGSPAPGLSESAPGEGAGAPASSERAPAGAPGTSEVATGRQGETGQGSATGPGEFFARAVALRGQLGNLRAPLRVIRSQVQLLPTLHFKGGTYQQMTGAIAEYNTTLGRLPAPVSRFANLPAVAGGAPVSAIGAVPVPVPELLPLIEALAAALAGLLALLGEILFWLAIAALVLLLLYMLYVIITTIVEAIAQAIEAMRPQPPIFWSMSLPPPPVATFVRTKPANPRVPGGQQSVVAAAIGAAGMSAVLAAHHIIPLFLGGRDELSAPPNVIPWPTALHIIGHASLVVQPQMSIWGYSINLYSHPPPAGYFLAGVKPP